MDNWLKSCKLNEIKRKWLQVVAPKYIGGEFCGRTKQGNCSYR